MDVGLSVFIQTDAQLWGAAAPVCDPWPAGGGGAAGHTVPGWSVGAGHTPGEIMINGEVFVNRDQPMKRKEGV